MYASHSSGKTSPTTRNTKTYSNSAPVSLKSLTDKVADTLKESPYRIDPNVHIICRMTVDLKSTSKCGLLNQCEAIPAEGLLDAGEESIVEIKSEQKDAAAPVVAKGKTKVRQVRHPLVDDDNDDDEEKMR